MDSYVTYLQITSAESGRTSLLQLPPLPHVSPFSLYGCCLLQMQVWGGGPRLLYWGSLPPPCRAVRALVCIFGGVIPQTRRRRWKKSLGDSGGPYRPAGGRQGAGRP